MAQQTLQEWLDENGVPTHAEILPDGRLINVVTASGAVWGVEVPNLANGLVVTRHPLTLGPGPRVTVNGVQYTIADYVMLRRGRDS
jgi:hypothetical protein